MQQQIANVTDQLQLTNSFDTWHGKHLVHMREIGSGMQKLHMHYHFSLLTGGRVSLHTSMYMFRYVCSVGEAPGLVGLLNTMGRGAVVGLKKLRRDSYLDILKW